MYQLETLQARGALRGDAGWVSPRPLEMTHDSVRHQIQDIRYYRYYRY